MTTKTPVKAVKPASKPAAKTVASKAPAAAKKPPVTAVKPVVKAKHKKVATIIKVDAKKQDKIDKDIKKEATKVFNKVVDTVTAKAPVKKPVKTKPNKNTTGKKHLTEKPAKVDISKRLSLKNMLNGEPSSKPTQAIVQPWEDAPKVQETKSVARLVPSQAPVVPHAPVSIQNKPELQHSGKSISMAELFTAPKPVTVAPVVVKPTSGGLSFSDIFKR